MLTANDCTLFSGGAVGAEAFFGALAERYGIQEINFSFDGHQAERTRGLRVLTNDELVLKDVSLSYVSKLLKREYTHAPIFRKVLQSICWQVSNGYEIFVVGTILEDGTVRGGTGWGAEFAKICNKPLRVFDQAKNGWFRWENETWTPENAPLVQQRLFTATGTRFLEKNGQTAVEELFARSFNKK
jgi:hypothetical protein